MTESFLQVGLRSAETEPDRKAFELLPDDAGEASFLTMACVDRRARAIAAAMEATPGDRALLLFLPGEDYTIALWSCLYAGAVAVPAYPPDPSRLQRTLPRLLAILRDAEATIVLTTKPLAQLAKMMIGDNDLGPLRWVTIDEVDDARANDWRAPNLDRSSLALLQYTSGSTAAPKGVRVTHGNLLDNAEIIHRSFEYSPDTRLVSWLPPYHDLGLVGGLLVPVYVGFTSTLMSPMAFLKRPLSWLEAISSRRADTAGGPNFGFDLCVRKTTESDRAQLDLRSWKTAFCAGEPIVAATVERFVGAFEGCGLAPSAFKACYGLAEGTLLASTAPVGTGAVIAEIDGVRRVSSGRPVQPLRIVNANTHEACADGEVGEIWLRGPSVADGYWRRDAHTMMTFGGVVQMGADNEDSQPHLRTGDLGRLIDGELFVTGRIKDLIIVGGAKYYPQDIEATVEGTGALRPGCTAAFAVEDGATERLVVVGEVGRDADGPAVIKTITAAVWQTHQISLSAVSLIKARSAMKTSSGKIQRQATKQAFLQGELDTVHDWTAKAYKR